MGWSAALGAAQVGAGLLGLDRNPYPAQARADQNRGRGYLSQYGNIGARQGQLADSAFGDYGTDNAAYRSAVSDESRFLENDPYTDSYGAAKTAGAYGSAAQSFTAARAHLQASAARNGMVDSGSLTGALGASYNAEAANSANIQNGLAQASIANRGQRLGQLTALTGGVANQDYSRGNAALSSEGGIYSRLGSEYLGMGQGEQAQGQAYDDAQGALIAGGAGMIGQSLYRPRRQSSTTDYGNAQPNPAAGGWYGGY